MTHKVKTYRWLVPPVLLLAAALITFPAGGTAAPPGSEHDASRRARSATPPAPIRKEPARQNGELAVQQPPVTASSMGKRDPFEVPPPPKADGGGNDPDSSLPPGVRGLVIGQLRLEGIVRDEESGSMIAVVTNHSTLAYFLHLHEEVYNGVVSRIAPGAIYFHQKSPGSGGRLESREIVLKLGSEPQEAR